MKLFQTIFLFLTVLVAVLAQEEHQQHHEEQHHQEQQQQHHQEVNCDAVCNERVEQAVRPVHEEKVRAEEWGHGVRRELDEAYNRMRALEEEAQNLRAAVEERDRAIGDRDRSINDLRGNLEGTQRDLENSRREVDQVKHDSTTEIDELRTKAEESSRSLGRVQFALDEANDQIKEMESARISLNLKGIQQDVQVYWKNLLGWWTGLIMPDKKKKEEEDL